MRLKTILMSVGILLACETVVSTQGRLVTYPAPEGEEMKYDFEVNVRQLGGEWKPVDTYAVKVDRVHEERHQVEKASLSYFDFEGEVEVSVKFRQGNIREARVRPLS